MKISNPLHYPLAILVGGITLIIGVRVLRVPNPVIIPFSVGVAIAGASLLASKKAQSPSLDNPELLRELQAVKQQAKILAEKGDILKQEAIKLLENQGNIELLAIVQYACDRTHELPYKIDQLSQRFQGTDSLLSITDLQQQLKEIDRKIYSSTGASREQLLQLKTSLQRNLELAQQGQDTRYAQLVNLKRFITDSAGVLQELQNKLRTTNLKDTTQTHELESLSQELKQFSENVDWLVSQ